jgi:hypothetical protein
MNKTGAAGGRMNRRSSLCRMDGRKSSWCQDGQEVSSWWQDRTEKQPLQDGREEEQSVAGSTGERAAGGRIYRRWSSW